MIKISSRLLLRTYILFIYTGRPPPPEKKNDDAMLSNLSFLILAERVSHEHFS